MDFDSRPTQVLHAALLQLLRPLVRVLLRQGMPFGAFEDIAKQAYVEVALTEFALPDKRPTISRASILTGLTRKEVQRLLTKSRGDGAATAERYNRAARVLAGWVRDPRYLDAQGQPVPLPVDGDLSFASLVREHSGDMPARAVLDELLRVGAVTQDEAGRYMPVTRAYVPQQGTLDKLGILGRDVADLIETIDHNIEHGAGDPRFQRKVMYDAIPVAELPAFRKLSAAQAQSLLERLDAWLARHDLEPGPHTADIPSARVGLGIYYFEERALPDANAPQLPPSPGEGTTP